MNQAQFNKPNKLFSIRHSGPPTGVKTALAIDVALSGTAPRSEVHQIAITHRVKLRGHPRQDFSDKISSVNGRDVARGFNPRKVCPAKWNFTTKCCCNEAFHRLYRAVGSTPRTAITRAA
jgi:hypothetical protein